MAYNFSENEKKILQFWEENQIFKKTLEKTEDKKPFVFYDGPPFATGLPHYGHLLQSAIKDVIPRYKTMQGFYVARQWGWDCHGLPIENIVEKELGTKSKKDIAQMGVKKFNDLCRERVFTFIKDWEQIIPRFGRWADMANPYRTMDFDYMQSEWWAFKELYEKGLVYEDYRSMHICPRCETTLSQGEVAEGYKDVKDFSATLKFKLKNPEKLGLSGDVYILAWTTTPWTLPGNVALAVGEKIKYASVINKDFNYIVAVERLGEVFEEGTYGDREEFLGKDLVGLEYEPLFDYYAKDENLKNRENGWKVVSADFVTTEDGTGIVHIAPAFGADDMLLGKEKNLPFVQHVKMDGTFKPEVLDFPGLDLKVRAKNNPEEIREADLSVVKFLGEKVFEYKKYEHAYPHCWRCDTALLNYATSSWFVAVEKLKPTLLETAKKIYWVPEHIKEGRFGQWLAGARDWSISRQRFWANTIPVWRCDSCKKDHVFASAVELQKASGVLVNDLHKDVVDEVTFTCHCGGTASRVPDVLDTWFDSGSVSFASLGYPLHNKKELAKRLPANFIGEGQDQTRAWFYYQHVLIGALFGKEAFKNCVVTGIVLAEDGKKMSKKLKNYPDPVEIMEKHGADAMRFYMLSSPVVRAENLLFSENGVAEIKRKLLVLQNVYSFLETYVEKKDFPTKTILESEDILDQWIVSRMDHVVSVVSFNLDNYDIAKAVTILEDFVINDLSLWYLRRSRKRFHENAEGRKEAIATLYYVLLTTTKVMAPIIPFFAEQMYQTLKTQGMPESVHLSDWPNTENKGKADLYLEEKMEEVRNVVNLALAERAKHAVKVRQPLAWVKVKDKNSKIKNEAKLLELICDEINVKEVLFDDKIENDVELNLQITPELKEEGMVRDIIRDIQSARKEKGLKPEDRVAITLSVSKANAPAIERNRETILQETRANDISVMATQEETIKIEVEKVN